MINLICLSFTRLFSAKELMVILYGLSFSISLEIWLGFDEWEWGDNRVNSLMGLQ